MVIAEMNNCAEGTAAAQAWTPGSAFPDRAFRSSDTTVQSSRSPSKAAAAAGQR
jgi:hypothetical protein